MNRLHAGFATLLEAKKFTIGFGILDSIYWFQNNSGY